MRFTIKNLYWIDVSILLLALIVTLLGIGSYGLYEPHEGHFAMVGQEMLLRDDWITPHLNGSPYLNKPPLLYWLIATTSSIFGYTEFAARLPIGLMGWLGIVVAWKWTRELWGINTSRVAALMLSVTLGWFIFTHQILLDVLLSTLLLSSNYFLWRCVAMPSDLSLDQPRSWLNWLGAYLSLALCVLTKGIIGVVFPLIGCFALAIVRQDWKIIKRIKLYQGLLLVLAVILPWFIAVEQANPGFLHYFIVNEHFDRLLDRRFPPDYEVSKISAIGYLGITACWCFPWILFLPSVIKSTFQEWQRGFQDNASIVEHQNSDGLFLLAIGAILPVILFLPLSSRLIYYSIPAIPHYIILCAGWWDKKYSLQSETIEQSSPIIDRPSSINNHDFSVGTICKFSLQVAECQTETKTVNIYSAIAIALGICFASLIRFHPLLVNLLPPILNTPEIIRLIIIVAIALGLAWLVTGMGMLRRSSLAWIPLFLALTITYLATIRGFVLYQDIRSSKTLVQQADSCLSIDTLWIFEGSREIGAAGAIDYYLNQNLKVSSPQHPTPGWTTGKERDYRTVMILSDGGKNRIPPQFPGSSPEYLITQSELQQYWNSDRPVVFLTDFLRQKDDNSDPLTRNLPRGVTEPYLIRGQRKLYLNDAAKKLASQKCN
ncbi:MAG: glycosyltransferase family 39 protein [Pleurocapsa sp. MO_192.B19]|nr:glycosyltransferase family 39 protein [Pleurocapsa sp. MO_192.B19]